MRLIIILLFKVLCFNITYSQEVITGKIVDENNDPLVGINIFFEEDKLIGTTTDINGNYSLELKNDYPVTIVISGISYETQNITIRSGSDLVNNIILSESVLLGQDGSTIKTIAFNAIENEVGAYLLTKKNKTFNILGKFSLNEWKGEKNVEFIIDDISVNKKQEITVPSSIG